MLALLQFLILVDDELSDKRISECSGCKIPHSVHEFGLPSPHCTGTEGLPESLPESPEGLPEGVPEGLSERWSESLVVLNKTDADKEAGLLALEEHVKKEKPSCQTQASHWKGRKRLAPLSSPPSSSTIAHFATWSSAMLDEALGHGRVNPSRSYRRTRFLLVNFVWQY